MHRFRKESWVKKVEHTHPLGWSTSGREYGDFLDPASNLEWKKSEHAAAAHPPHSWTPDPREPPPRSLYSDHFTRPPSRDLNPGPWTYRESERKRGVGSFKPGRTNRRSRVPHLPPLHDSHVNWVVRENQRTRHPHHYKSMHDIFDFKFRGAWKPFVHG